MSVLANQFADSLRIKLVKMGGQIDGIKADVKLGKSEDHASIENKLKMAKLGVKTMGKDLKSAETKMQNWLKAKEKSGVSVIRGWVSLFDKNKLDRHAKTAEENAVAAISLAEGKIAEAVLATYEAIDARMTADETPEAKH